MGYFDGFKVTFKQMFEPRVTVRPVPSLSLVAGMRDAQLEPTSVVAAWRGADLFGVAVRFEGFRA